MSTQKYALPQFKSQFPDDASCLEFMFDTLHSRKCSCGGEYRLLFRKGKDNILFPRQFQCSKCRFQISPRVNTIFEKSSTPLNLWFHAVFAFASHKSGISAKTMQRELGVTYKTAWRMLDQIRKALRNSGDKLDGVVETDAGFIGGTGRQATRLYNKTPVMAAIQRGGEMRAQVVADLSASETKRFIAETVKPGSILLTDGAQTYKHASKGYDRFSVNHKQERVRGNIHVNKVESFFSHLKRSLRGTHKATSREHLQSYLDGFVFHYNNRHSDKARFDALFGALLRFGGSKGISSGSLSTV